MVCPFIIGSITQSKILNNYFLIYSTCKGDLPRHIKNIYRVKGINQVAGKDIVADEIGGKDQHRKAGKEYQAAYLQQFAEQHDQQYKNNRHRSQFQGDCTKGQPENAVYEHILFRLRKQALLPFQCVVQAFENDHHLQNGHRQIGAEAGHTFIDLRYI